MICLNFLCISFPSEKGVLCQSLQVSENERDLTQHLAYSESNDIMDSLLVSSGSGNRKVRKKGGDQSRE